MPEPVSSITPETIASAQEKVDALALASKSTSEILKDTLEKDRIPGHKEILDTYNSGLRDERLDLGVSLLNKAFAEIGNPDKDLSTLLQHPDYKEGIVFRGNEQVKIFAKEVLEERPKKNFGNLLERLKSKFVKDYEYEPEMESVETGQVLVTAVFKNGKTPAEMTTVSIICNNKGETASVNAGDRTLYVSSLEAFNKALKAPDKRLKQGIEEKGIGKSNSYDYSKFLRGELSTDGFEKEYKDTHGKSLGSSWKTWNKEIRSSRTEGSTGRIQNMIEHLNTDYSQIEKVAQETRADIVEKLAVAQQELMEQHKKFIEQNPTYSLLVSDVTKSMQEVIRSGTPAERARERKVLNRLLSSLPEDYKNSAMALLKDTETQEVASLKDTKAKEALLRKSNADNDYISLVGLLTKQTALTSAEEAMVRNAVRLLEMKYPALGDKFRKEAEDYMMPTEYLANALIAELTDILANVPEVAQKYVIAGKLGELRGPKADEVRKLVKEHFNPAPQRGNRP